VSATPEYWHNATHDLAKRCKVMARLIKQHPVAKLRMRGNAFSTLARAIVGQQISVKAADAIWRRVLIAAGQIKSVRFAAMTVEELRTCGLSSSKVIYLKDLARFFNDKLVNPRRWPNMTDDEVIADLVAIKGIGRWTAEMFLIFYLARPNIFPADDIGLIRAIERHFHAGAILSKPEIAAYRSRYTPFNTVATWYFWRSLEPEPALY